jgi:hypothetical protein
VWDILTVVALLAVYAVTARCLARSNRATVMAFAFVAILCTLLLFSKKSWPNYIPMVLFPICLLVAHFRPSLRLGFLFFSVIAVVEASYWMITMRMMGSQEFHAILPTFQGRPLLFLLLQFLLLAGYASLLFAAILKMRAASASPKTQPPQ